MSHGVTHPFALTEWNSLLFVRLIILVFSREVEQIWDKLHSFVELQRTSSSYGAGYIQVNSKRRSHPAKLSTRDERDLVQAIYHIWL